MLFASSPILIQRLFYPVRLTHVDNTPGYYQNYRRTLINHVSIKAHYYETLRQGSRTCKRAEFEFEFSKRVFPTFESSSTFGPIWFEDLHARRYSLALSKRFFRRWCPRSKALPITIRSGSRTCMRADLRWHCLNASSDSDTLFRNAHTRTNARCLGKTRLCSYAAQ